MVCLLFTKEKDTGKVNRIRVFEKTHYKEGKGWANEACEADWGKIQEELAKTMRDAADSSTPVDEIGVLERALGTKRGHIRGVGRVVRRIIPEISSACPPPQQEWQKMQQEMQQMRQEMQEMRQQQQNEQHQH
ncbi:uncharacterized protein LOC143575398 [Bidens hawaiensis]|uniref:uncharacterized protein LOC143575398 n=1 Tax=Bidens hawaiensis TaxID=980011 RepID=UPI004048F4B6